MPQPSMSPFGAITATFIGIVREEATSVVECIAAQISHLARRAGVFANGDVRSGSIKRVAAAVGEGAQVVAALHGYLDSAGNKSARTSSPLSKSAT